MVQSVNTWQLLYKVAMGLFLHSYTINQNMHVENEFTSGLQYIGISYYVKKGDSP